jgi:hypothetical protein
MWTDVSEERITSIFRVENEPSKKPACSRWLDSLPAGRYTQENGNIYNYRCENLKSLLKCTSLHTPYII